MDEENLARLLQAFSNCNYIEFVKIFSMIHGFDATFEFLRNALTTIPFMAFKKKFWMFGGDDEKKDTPPTTPPIQAQPTKKRQHVRSTWEEEEENNEFWNNMKKQPSQILYDSDHDYNTNRIKYNDQNQGTHHHHHHHNNSNSKSQNQNNVHSSNSFKNIKQSRKKLKPINYNTNNYINNSAQNIQELPFEILIMIFSFLGIADINSVSLVSREWNRYAFVSTTELKIDNRKWLSVDIVNKKIYKHSDYLKTVQFFQSKIIGYSSVRMIVDHCRNIQDIEFHHCPLINDTEIDLVCTLLPKLAKLVVHSESLSVKIFDSLLKAPVLVSLELGGFSRLPVESFARLADLQHLTTLDVSKIAKPICVPLQQCKHITSLRLAAASESSIGSLPFLGQLEMLCIDQWELETEVTSTSSDMSTVTTVCAQEADGSYLKFLEKCIRLSKFEITGASDFVIRSLSSLLCVRHTLRVLDLDMVLGGGNSNVEESFRKVLPLLINLEALFISKFSLGGEAWEAFSRIPRLTFLSLCCNRLNSHIVSRGLEHISRCKNLEKLSIINSTEHWIEISERPFSGLISLKDTLLELRLGGSRGGGWVLNEGIFTSFARMDSLKVLDLSNSRGITEQCLAHLSQCASLEFLEGSVKIDEQIFQNTIAEWCGTGTLINCPTLRKVSFDIKLPQLLNSEISCPNTSNHFNLYTKISQ